MPLAVVNRSITLFGFYPLYSPFINSDLVTNILAKTNDKKVRRFGDILAPLSRETKIIMRFTSN